MKKSLKYNGYALAGTLVFLIIVLIAFLGVTRQIGTFLRIEKNFQSQKIYYDTAGRAFAWGLSLLQTGLPPTNPYSCRMQVGTDSPQTFVATFTQNSALNYKVTVRPANSGDSSLPQAPESFGH